MVWGITVHLCLLCWIDTSTKLNTVDISCFRIYGESVYCIWRRILFFTVELFYIGIKVHVFSFNRIHVATVMWPMKPAVSLLLSTEYLSSVASWQDWHQVTVPPFASLTSCWMRVWNRKSNMHSKVIRYVLNQMHKNTQWITHLQAITNVSMAQTLPPPIVCRWCLCLMNFIYFISILFVPKNIGN